MHTYSAVLAADPSLTSIEALAMRLLGSGLIILVAWRIMSAWTRRAYGELVMEIAAVVLVSFFVVTPDSAMTFIGTLRTDVFGA